MRPRSRSAQQRRGLRRGHGAAHVARDLQARAARGRSSASGVAQRRRARRPSSARQWWTEIGQLRLRAELVQARDARASSSFARAAHLGLACPRRRAGPAGATSGSSVSPWTISVTRITHHRAGHDRVAPGEGRAVASSVSGSASAAASETTPRTPHHATTRRRHGGIAALARAQPRAEPQRHVRRREASTRCAPGSRPRDRPAPRSSEAPPRRAELAQPARRLEPDEHEAQALSTYTRASRSRTGPTRASGGIAWMRHATTKPATTTASTPEPSQRVAPARRRGRARAARARTASASRATRRLSAANTRPRPRPPRTPRPATRRKRSATAPRLEAAAEDDRDAELHADEPGRVVDQALAAEDRRQASRDAQPLDAPPAPRPCRSARRSRRAGSTPPRAARACSACATSPTTRIVSATSPTASIRIGRSQRRKSTHEVSKASA